ncbi:hypothetical protein [Bifidobacterium scaligerum]|uniref:Uncharacterized protein n=1 Tax=Bifidobacterium scaligerum TaxID=2052656 RepID=A0A2M9HQD3_9BIFI|nr:hypothetical protein [Bifidobacterium scaligerum]PJM79040.1 hypothetical protein CUU80_06815 [Bifidobacterium scaligerum]
MTSTLRATKGDRRVLEALLRFRCLSILSAVRFSGLALSSRYRISRRLHAYAERGYARVITGPSAHVVFTPTPKLIPLLELETPPLRAADASAHALAVSSIASQLAHGDNVLHLPDDEWENIRVQMEDYEAGLVCEADMRMAESRLRQSGKRDQAVTQMLHLMDTQRDDVAYRAWAGGNPYQSWPWIVMAHGEAWNTREQRIVSDVYAESDSTVIALTDHRPDLVLARPFHQSIAIEVELTRKPVNDYIATMAGYTTRQSRDAYSQVVWIATSETTAHAIRRGITATGTEQLARVVMADSNGGPLWGGVDLTTRA